MTNPVAPNTVPFPPVSTPFVDPTSGQISTPWYLMQLSMYNRTGGQQGLSLATVQTVANNAQSTAAGASASATLAQSQAGAAQTSANEAKADAELAQATAAEALAAATGGIVGVLYSANNLSDVSSEAVARANLGVATVPLSLIWHGTIPSGQVTYLPIVQNLTMAARFAGLLTWCGTPAALDALFRINYIRSGAINAIGTITLIPGGQHNTTSPNAGVNLLVGDILQIIAPSPADTSLADLGITFSTSLT